jgi:hypothetical protein
MPWTLKQHGAAAKLLRAKPSLLFVIQHACQDGQSLMTAVDVLNVIYVIGLINVASRDHRSLKFTVSDPIRLLLRWWARFASMERDWQRAESLRFGHF